MGTGGGECSAKILVEVAAANPGPYLLTSSPRRPPAESSSAHVSWAVGCIPSIPAALVFIGCPFSLTILIGDPDGWFF